jgi:glucan phosphorylase
MAAAKISLLNIAESGVFAADRAVQEYADHIWHI